MGKTTTKTIVVLAAVFVLIAVFQARRTSGPSPEEFRAQALFPELVWLRWQRCRSRVLGPV